MTDALKRISKTKDQAFQDKCSYYMYQKAAAGEPEEYMIYPEGYIER